MRQRREWSEGQMLQSRVTQLLAAGLAGRSLHCKEEELGQTVGKEFLNSKARE